MLLNRILTNKDREDLKPLIEKMFEWCPETMSRKIAEANVQQAFALEYIMKLLAVDEDMSALCVGSFEDTTSESLVAQGHDIVNIDPLENVDLATFRKSTDEKFDIIFSVSVIEHVFDDEEFIDDICNLLSEKGIAVLTCDFKNSYKAGDPLPATDVRFFTKVDLEERLPAILKKNGCSLFGESNWETEPNFIYQGHHYSFATFVFTKD